MNTLEIQMRTTLLPRHTYEIFLRQTQATDAGETSASNTPQTPLRSQKVALRN